MTTRSTRWRRDQQTRRIRAASVAIALATIAACTAQPETHSPPSSRSRQSEDPSKAPPSLSAAEVAGRKAMEIYTAMWMSMAEAAETADWRSPLLSRYATGTALNTLSRGIYVDHTKGWVSRGRPTLSPTVASVEPEDAPTRVRIADCGDSTNWLKYDASTGLLANDVLGGRRAISALVDKQDGGTWLVSDFAVREVGSC